MSDEQNPSEETQPILPASDGSPWAPPVGQAPPPAESSVVEPSPVAEPAAVPAAPEPTAVLPTTPPPPTIGLPAAAAAFPPPARGPRQERRTPGWMWPAIAALSLVLGLVGGIAGSAIYRESSTRNGGSADGLNGVDLAPLPPLKNGGSVAAVAAAVLPSTVQIVAEYGGEADGATGSGFVLDKQGHIITNNHVVKEAVADKGPITVVYQGGKRYSATVVGTSQVYDLAVLYVKNAPDAKPASLGQSRAMRVGDPVVAVGSPLGLSATVTSGIVSAMDRPVSTGETQNDQSFIDAIQTDAAINPGNSGGPLVDLHGDVIGVNSAIATSGGGSTSGTAGNIGVGFAIPVEQVRVTTDQILRSGKAEYPLLGVSLKAEKSLNFDGPTVQAVTAGSGADGAGIEVGDRITSVDGEAVTDNVSLVVAVRKYQPGDKVKIGFVRDGKASSAEITLTGKVG
ncbi:S1C family serine protease [Nocardioides montaniterrae]